MAYLYCLKCGEKIEYKGEGELVCPVCSETAYPARLAEDTLELHSKASWYLTDEQYYNALQMYDIILKADESDYSALFGAILSEFGARYKDLHDGTYEFACERTHEHSVYESEYYKRLRDLAPSEAMEIYAPVLEAIDSEQKKNKEQYLATAPVDENRDYRREAREIDEELADDYLTARDKYQAKLREEEEEAERRRLEAKEREEAAKRARENRAALAAKKAKRKKTVIISAASAFSVVLCVVLAFTLVIPAIHLGSAKRAIEEGRLDDAAISLRAAGGFNDSEVLLCKYRLFGLEKGDSVIFGEYEQDASKGNGAEDIEWIVLASSEESVTMIARYVLDCVMYHENKDAPAYWSSASLRTWLDVEFKPAAFAEAERALLMPVINDNPDNDRCGTKGGEDTEDCVYLLSIDEAERLLAGEELIGIPTEYAKERGVYTKSEYIGTYWWLRSPGGTQNSAAKVNGDGKIDIRGSGVNYTSYGVRPVITVKKSVIE